MKRDMDLVRAILLELEKHEDSILSEEIIIGGYTAKQIGYHCRLLLDANLIAASDISTMGTPHQFLILYITNDGHEFLASIKTPKIWAQIKQISKEQAIELTIDAVKQLGKRLIATLVI